MSENMTPDDRPAVGDRLPEDDRARLREQFLFRIRTALALGLMRGKRGEPAPEGWAEREADCAVAALAASPAPVQEEAIRADERERIRRRWTAALEADDRCGYAEAFGIAMSEVAPRAVMHPTAPAPVVPDSPDLRERVEALINGDAGPSIDPRERYAITDAVLAVVHPTATAPQAPGVTLTTVEALNALPQRSVVLDPHGMAWQRRRTCVGTLAWFAAGVIEGHPRCALPARVLDLPGTPVVDAPAAPGVMRVLRDDDDLSAILAVAGEAGVPVVVREGFRVWVLTEDEDGEWWAWSWRKEGEGGKPVRVTTLSYPLAVVDAPAAPEPCICDGASYEVKAHPFLVHPGCPIHAQDGAR